jgi:hypothetical protein
MDTDKRARARSANDGAFSWFPMGPGFDPREGLVPHAGVFAADSADCAEKRGFTTENTENTEGRSSHGWTRMDTDKTSTSPERERRGPLVVPDGAWFGLPHGVCPIGFCRRSKIRRGEFRRFRTWGGEELKPRMDTDGHGWRGWGGMEIERFGSGASGRALRARHGERGTSGGGGDARWMAGDPPPRIASAPRMRCVAHRPDRDRPRLLRDCPRPFPGAARTLRDQPPPLRDAPRPLRDAPGPCPGAPRSSRDAPRPCPGSPRPPRAAPRPLPDASRPGQDLPKRGWRGREGGLVVNNCELPT